MFISLAFIIFILNHTYKNFLALLTCPWKILDAKVAILKSIQPITLNECYLGQYKGYSDNLCHSSLLHLHTMNGQHSLHCQIMENASMNPRPRYTCISKARQLPILCSMTNAPGTNWSYGCSWMKPFIWKQTPKLMCFHRIPSNWNQMSITIQGFSITWRWRRRSIPIHIHILFLVS